MASVDGEDSTYSSTSDAEPDSDHEGDDPDELQKLLGTWLGELEHLKLGLDNATPTKVSPVGERLSIPAPRMDSYRFSMANLEDSQDVELDAILGELCALESQFDQEMMHRGHARSVSSVIQNNMTGENLRYSSISGSLQSGLIHGSSSSSGYQDSSQGPKRFFSHSRSSSGGTRAKFEICGDVEYDDHIKMHKMEYGLRTDSPDNDSAFSDSVSMLSSESSTSSGGARTDISSQCSSKTNSIAMVSSPTQIFIKAFSADNSAKSLLVDERMTVGHVCHLLADKNHVPMDPRWTLIEHVPELYMERMYEDHEYLVENLLLWTRDSSNKLLFLEKEEKYDLFNNPENYLLMGSSSEKGIELDDDAKITLLEEFFSTSGVPEVESALYLKSDGKKVWKKHFFVLRASGIYYCPKGKSKLSKDLICLTTFEMNNIYMGFGWKKKYKAPSEFGFAIKHPQIQTKSSKYIKYLCADDERTFKLWIMGIRLAKYGLLLKENYDNLMRDIVEEDLDTLAHARSFSVSSMAKTLAVSSDSSGSSGSPDRQDISLEDVVFSGPKAGSTTDGADPDVLSNRSSNSTPTPTPIEWTNQRCSMIRKDSVKSSTSSSSGCLSERSSVSTPTAEQVSFENDIPVGTIKRKPSLTPKIPLTNTTRNIAKQSAGEESLYNVEVDPINLGGGSVGRNVGLRLSLSLRRSHTDDKIMVNGATRSGQRNGSIDTTSFLLKTKEVESLPPPPNEIRGSIESIDLETLPPPPPEAFGGSTLSLDSLPPPPPPLTEESSWPSTSSLNSLPPPPSPLLQMPTRQINCLPAMESSPTENKFQSAPEVPPKPRNGRRMSEADVSVVQSPPPYLAELKLGQNSLSRAFGRQHMMERLNIEEIDESPVVLRSPTQNSNTFSMLDRRASAPAVPMSLQLAPPIGFNQSPTSCPTPTSELPPPPPPPPPPPTSHPLTLPPKKSKPIPKPQPPRRSETTRLSSDSLVGLFRRSSVPSTLPGQGGSIACPPESFLRDLQRVMEKKWKVAQQLSVDLSATAHEILGFRDPCYLAPTEQGTDPLTPPPPPPPPPPHSQRPRSSSQSRHRMSLEDSMTPKKRPPPPPPKRSETTQLSRKQ